MNPTAPPVIPPQPSTQQPIVITPDTVTPKKKFKISKTVLGIMAVVVIAIAIPVTLYVISQRQTITQQAAPATAQPPATAVAQVYNAYILQPELDAFITSSGKEKIDALQLLIERKVLDEESKRTNVAVTDPEITAELKKSGTEDFEKIREFTKYELLKEKILKANVKYIEAQVISFWLPPTDYPVEIPAAKKQEIATQRAQQKELLTQIQTKFDAKEDPVALAREVNEKFPAFNNILALNGKNVTTTTEDIILREPYIHIVKSEDQETPLGILLEGMNQNEVKQLELIDGSGGMVAMVTDKHTATFDSYEEWLADKKSKFVKVF